jgi:hypothetical protein
MQESLRIRFVTVVRSHADSFPNRTLIIGTDLDAPRPRERPSRQSVVETTLLHSATVATQPRTPSAARAVDDGATR